MNNKSLSLLALAVSAAISSSSYAGINNVSISKDVEGTSNNKAIEILATKSSSITPCRDAKGISQKRIGEIQGEFIPFATYC